MQGHPRLLKGERATGAPSIQLPEYVIVIKEDDFKYNTTYRLLLCIPAYKLSSKSLMLREKNEVVVRDSLTCLAVPLILLTLFSRCRRILSSFLPPYCFNGIANALFV